MDEKQDGGAPQDAPRTFRCGDCSKEFDTEASLTQHKNDAHGQKTEQPKNPSHHRKINKGKIIMYAIVGLLVAAIGYGIYYWSTSDGSNVNLGPLGSTHIHADYAIYVDNEQFNLSPAYYQRNSYVHMHSPYISLIHVHATGVTLGFFLKTLSIDMDGNCLNLQGQAYCNEGGRTLKVFVNSGDGWLPINPEVANNYLIEDLDKILITYGNSSSTDIEAQQNSVTNLAIQASTGAISG
jgi:uncharacterized C2H2 Zn-finger protein